MGEQKVGRLGRPPKLDHLLAAEIAGHLIAGRSTADVAHMLKVSRRSIVGWRSRAWSRDPRDRECVELEQMIVRGKLAAAEIGQPWGHASPRSTLPPLDDVLAAFDGRD